MLEFTKIKTSCRHEMNVDDCNEIPKQFTFLFNSELHVSTANFCAMKSIRYEVLILQTTQYMHCS